ncbi:MAG: c-type cytochrome biogenesis protein CcsB [Thermodesulfobacteriota bacterium]
MNLIFFEIALVIYLIGLAAALAYLITLKKTLSWISSLAIGLGFLMHTSALVFRYLEAGYTPITNLHEALSFFAWSIIAVYLLLQMKYRVEVLGAFISPLAIIMILLASIFPCEIFPLPPALRSFWLPIHVALAFLGNAMFAVAFAVAIMYLLQERQIKKKKIGSVYHRLPSLRVLDELNYRCLTWGFPLMTLGIVSGSVWAQSAWGTYWSWDPKETWSLITWFVYAALLHGRLTIGWRGRKAAVLAIVGFASVVFTFLGVNLLLTGLHGYN